MKRFIILTSILIATIVGFEHDYIKDGIVGGFNNVRGVANLQRTSECSTYVIPESASTSIDWGNGCVQHLTRQVSENLTISSFSNGERHGELALVILASTSSPATITWPSSVKWASSSQNAPSLSGVNQVDVIRFYAVSSGSYYGVYQSGVKGAPQ